MNNIFYEIIFVYKNSNDNICFYTKDNDIIQRLKSNSYCYSSIYKLKNVSNTRLSEIQFLEISDEDKNTSKRLQDYGRIEYVLAIGDFNILHTSNILSSIIKEGSIYVLDVFDSNVEKAYYIFLSDKVGKYCEVVLYSFKNTWQGKQLKTKSKEFQRIVKKMKKERIMLKNKNERILK